MYNVEWRRQYHDQARDEILGELTAVDFTDAEDLTVQSFKEETDINTILRRFGVTGHLPLARGTPLYGDFSNAVDYQTALNMTHEAQRAFDALPSRIRKRFNNNPAELIAFLQDDNNREESDRLGLTVPEPPDPNQIDIEEVITPP